MWSTPGGDRVLQGYEAELIRETVAVMIDELEMQSEHPAFPRLQFGISVWDGLTWQQKLATIDQVVRHLLQPTASALPLTAISEAAVGAIFEQVKCNIEIELDFESMEADSDFHEGLSWRTLVLRASQEPCYEDGEVVDEECCEEDGDDLHRDFYPKGPEDTRKQCWYNVIEQLADRVLWDRDYEMEHVFADVAPNEATEMKDYMGVDEEYYQQAAPDLRDDMVSTMIERVKAITHGKRRDIIDDCDF